MAERRTAGAPGTTPAPAGPPGAPQGHHQTASVRALAAGAQVPNWFWVVLGCLSVLGVGFTVLFVVVRTPATAVVRPATAPAAAPTAAAPGIQVEQLAPPSPPRPAAPARKPAPRVVKVARTSSPTPHTAKAEADDEGAADTEDADPDEEPTPKAKPSRPHAAAPAAEDAEGSAEP
jgi:hypothetical protein